MFNCLGVYLNEHATNLVLSNFLSSIDVVPRYLHTLTPFTSES